MFLSWNLFILCSFVCPYFTFLMYLFPSFLFMYFPTFFLSIFTDDLFLRVKTSNSEENLFKNFQLFCRIDWWQSIENFPHSSVFQLTKILKLYFKKNLKNLKSLLKRLMMVFPRVTIIFRLVTLAKTKSRKRERISSSNC